MPRSRATANTFCDLCKVEFGSYDSKSNIWTFKDGVSGHATWTFVSEMSKSKGAVRSYCEFHIKETQLWPPAKPTEIWTLKNQLAYSKLLEMREANV